MDGKTYTVTLDKGKEIKETAFSGTTWGDTYVCGPGSGVFHSAEKLDADLQHALFQVNHGPKQIKTVTRFPARFYPAIM